MSSIVWRDMGWYELTETADGAERWIKCAGHEANRDEVEADAPEGATVRFLVMPYDDMEVIIPTDD